MIRRNTGERRNVFGSKRYFLNKTEELSSDEALPCTISPLTDLPVDS